MICRLWRGWTTAANAPIYEAIVRGEVIPGIEARRIPGFLAIDLLRREPPEGGCEFTTLMWFDTIDAIRTFMGEDYARSHVPDVARAVLSTFDDYAAHYEVLDRRLQPRGET